MELFSIKIRRTFQLVSTVLGIEPNPEINRKLWEETIKFAVIAT